MYLFSTLRPFCALMLRQRQVQRRRGAKAPQRRTTRPLIEELEPRLVLDAGFRSISGLGNNMTNPNWGQAGADLLRVSPPAYADGMNAPSQPNNLSPRQISNDLNNQSSPIFSGADNLGPNNTQSLSDFAYVWGQFIDHDMDLTPGGSDTSFPIPVDPTRPADPMGMEPFTRSQFDPNTGTTNPRQQVNANTAYLDLSQVYGSSDFVANALRTGSGGQMKTSPGNLLPLNNLTYFTQPQLDALNMANDAKQVPNDQLFAAGDVRANENIELTAMQTLFVRNHNRLADELQSLHPNWGDDKLYQEARKLNIATEEMITYNEYLPTLFGPNVLPAYKGYQSGVNASIATEFSTVGFRFGHSLLSNTVGRDQNNGVGIADPTGSSGVNLAADFFDPNLLKPSLKVDPLTGHATSNIGAILKADADNAANEFDLMLIDEVRNTLFGVPHGPGTDLAARDVQRARDDGIGTYNQVRVAYGLKAVTSFADVTSNVTLQQQLQATYGTVDQIDPFEGMLAEDHLAGTDFGPTTTVILAKQFTALRDGDRFFYLNESFTQQEQDLIGQAPTLATVITANTAITNLQSNVFLFRESISGRVFNDPDQDGLPGTSHEKGVPGVTVNLNNASGNVVATTTTDSNGHYSFTDQTGIPGTGKFTVSIVVPLGDFLTTPSPVLTALSRGGLDIDGVDFGISPNTAGPMVVHSHAPSRSPGSGTGTGRTAAPGERSTDTDARTDLGARDGVSAFDLLRVLQAKKLVFGEPGE